MATDREFVRGVFPDATSYADVDGFWLVLVLCNFGTRYLGDGRHPVKSARQAWTNAAHAIHDNDERTGR